MTNDFTVFIPSHRPALAREAEAGLHPLPVIQWDGRGYPSFSKLVNDCIAASRTETVIICSDKVRPGLRHVERLLSYLQDGYAFAGLYYFAFFGFRKDLIRKIGFFDERFIGGECEDSDFILRMQEAGLPFLLSKEVPYLQMPSSWCNTLSRAHFVRKWGTIHMHLAQRLMPEEQYSYDLGQTAPVAFRRASAISEDCTSDGGSVEGLSEVGTRTGITGFSLFALCHNFGRRGRAMARSLARQEGCTVPIQLTVFHNRQEDAEFIAEGALDGPCPPALKMIKIPDDRIMQRALHFSDAHQMHQLSHTVYFDVDLWFPPDFWANFAYALSAEARGYWSCRVLNVPYPMAEPHVDRWNEITRAGLEAVAYGPRHNEFSGRVGHFQCIPRSLASYPADSLKGVTHADLVFSEGAIARSDNKRWERRIGATPAYHLGHPPALEGTSGVQL